MVKNVNNWKLKNFDLSVLLNICLIFCQFQPGVAYKSVGYKNKCVFTVPFLHFFCALLIAYLLIFWHIKGVGIKIDLLSALTYLIRLRLMKFYLYYDFIEYPEEIFKKLWSVTVYLKAKYMIN